MLPTDATHPLPQRTRRGFKIAGLILIALVAIFAVGEAIVGRRLQAAGPLTVLVASSLTDSAKELVRLYEFEHPKTKITLVFAASNQLRTQLEHVAPGDLFLSADEAQINAAAPLLVPSSVKPFARNTLAIITRENSPLKTFADLASAPTLRLVIADPAVPLGAYTLRILDAAAASPLGAPFKTAVLSNVRSRELNAKAVVAKVTLGEADAAIVYTSDARALTGVRTVPIPDEFNQSTTYLLAVVKASTQQSAASDFASFILSAPGQKILAQSHLLPPDPTPAPTNSPDAR